MVKHKGKKERKQKYHKLTQLHDFFFFSENYITKGMKISNFSSSVLCVFAILPSFLPSLVIPQNTRNGAGGGPPKNMADFYGHFFLLSFLSLFIISNTTNSPNNKQQKNNIIFPHLTHQTFGQISSLWSQAFMGSLFLIFININFLIIHTNS